MSDPQDISRPSETLKKKMDEERRKREQLLALNQAIAKEVMQKSKFVAGLYALTLSAVFFRWKNIIIEA